MRRRAAPGGACALAVLVLGTGGTARASSADAASLGEPSAGGVESLAETLGPAPQTLAQRLRRQLARLEAEAEIRERYSERRVDEARLALRGNLRDLERYRRRER